MLRPRVRLVVAASLVTAAAAIGVSCSFPVIIFQDGSSGSGGSTSASSTTATTSSSAGGTGGAGGSTTSESASTSGSTSSGTGGGLPCPTECDCDGDGVKAKSTACGGTDCADYDERAHPGAGFLRDPKKIQGPRSVGTQDYDFDCNGSVVPEAQTIMCGLLSTGLCGGEGFATATECGVPGPYIHCGLSGLNCVTVKTEMRVQGCK